MKAAIGHAAQPGHRGDGAVLFDALAENPGRSSAALADRAGVTERYLREWLGVMVTSGVVNYDAGGRSYTLPPEHAAVLTRAASRDDMAVTTQFIQIAASVEDHLLDRFQSHGGPCYRDFGRFHEVMAEDSAQLVVANLTEAILPVVPGWSSGWGAEARAEGLKNLRFRACDLSFVPSLGQFDVVTAFDAVHDQKDPQGFLALIRRLLRPGGVFLMQDIGGSRDLEKNIGNPFAPLLYTISSMHCTPISIGQGGPGTTLGVETAEEYLAAAGFAPVETHRLPHDPINAYFVARA